jgi:hypothetical protein
VLAEVGATALPANDKASIQPVWPTTVELPGMFGTSITISSAEAAEAAVGTMAIVLKTSSNTRPLVMPRRIDDFIPGISSLWDFRFDLADVHAYTPKVLPN